MSRLADHEPSTRPERPGPNRTTRGRAKALALVVLALCAGAVAGAADGHEESGFDRLWSHALLYKGDDDSFVRSLRFTGRFQIDAPYVRGDGRHHEEVDLRRFRLGFKLGLPEHVTIHAEADIERDEDRLDYNRLTDAYVLWSPSSTFELTVGKHSAAFTVDGMTSSKELLTIDRNNLSNNMWFPVEYIPGVSVSGETGRLIYDVGVYSSGGSMSGLGDFRAGQFVLVTLGHDFADASGGDHELLRVNLVHNDPDPGNNYTRSLEDIVSVNYSFETGGWGLRADVSAASGYLGQSDLWGAVVMPFWNLSEELQVVTRYTRVESDDPNGVRFARYESVLAQGRGDRYDELYLGVNYFWYGHKLKLQSGVEYVDMRDRADDGGAYSGVGWTTGFRASW